MGKPKAAWVVLAVDARSEGPGPGFGLLMS